jgi:hypothetical protein
MVQKANGLTKNYELLTPRERLRMLIEAQAREDFDEVNRLRNSCPRKVYRTLDHAFDAADDAVMTLTLVFCIDLAHHLGMVEMVRRLGRATEVLLILAGSEAGEDVANTVMSLVGSSDRRTSGETKGSKAQGEHAVRGNGKKLSEAAAALFDWMAGDADAVARFGAECLPQSHAAFKGLLSRLIADQVADVRAILEGFSRFTRRTLGLESVDVIRAWMPCIARRIEKLPQVASEFDAQLVAETEMIAWKYWRRMVTG